jgi:hypothetical protein
MAKTEGSIRNRLEATADRIAALRAELEDECETRDRLVLEATDLGWPRGQISSWAKITTTRVTQIVAEQGALAS